MAANGSAFRASLLLVALALAGCNGEPGGFEFSSPAAAPANPPIAMAGRWLLTSPGRGQCNMNFGQPTPSAAEGTIAPEGGCPGKFFTSRKWSYDGQGLVIRDHNGQPLAQLAAGGNGFNGKAASGELVMLVH